MLLEQNTLNFSWQAPWLAPMAGYSDLPFRLLCREYGAKVCVSEMLSAIGLCQETKQTWYLTKTTLEDQPVVLQLFGKEPKYFSLAIESLRRKGFAWFDCNLGCSVRKVVSQGAGVALMGDLKQTLAIAKAMLSAAGVNHVGFKLRLGLDSQHISYQEFALHLQDLGVGWISLHPRTAKQGFSGEANYEAIATLVDILEIPVIASGDLFTAKQGLECLKMTKASSVMYARGALANPAIFQQHLTLLQNGHLEIDEFSLVPEMIKKHLALLNEFSEQSPQNILKRLRSIIPRYVKNLPGAKALRVTLYNCQSWQELYQILNNYFGSQYFGSQAGFAEQII